MLDDIKKDAVARMQKCIQAFQADLKKLRTGRAHPSLVEGLKVDFYGSARTARCTGAPARCRRDGQPRAAAGGCAPTGRCRP